MLAQGKVIISCNSSDFCFFSENLNLTAPSHLSTSGDPFSGKNWRQGSLLPNSKALCIDTPTGEDVLALKEIGVVDSVGIFKKPSPPLIIQGEGRKHPFPGDSFDFEFSGKGGFFEEFVKPAEFAGEICRTLQPEGFLEVHTTARDSYIFNSFLELFNCCELIGTR
ncbi:methyltransferase [Medicago truncatula]|uniref:Methyltransferase n=1 Tax=Medicago truncatula TaxID=3880 RepID=G7ID10_MEDTR|nr:methyltransferase [Medicago truncatula]